MKLALVCGAGGFIGSHLVKQLCREGYWVRGADLKHPEFSASAAHDFVACDLRDPRVASEVVDRAFDEVYQLAADMGGAGYVFTGENDANVMHHSASINLNVVEACRKRAVKRVFYASSACIYPARNQQDSNHPRCSEDTAYPADPDSEYGWEKLFSERLYLAYRRNHGMECRIARYHNIYGPEGAWNNGKEKAPAAICRKVALAADGSEIEIWGDGKQTRSFLFVDECVEGTLRLMRSSFHLPLNIGSEEMISINGLVSLVAEIAGKRVSLRHVPGPTGVRGRNSDNTLAREVLGWSPTGSLRQGLEKTYAWIEQQATRSAGTGDRSLVGFAASPGSA